MKKHLNLQNIEKILSTLGYILGAGLLINTLMILSTGPDSSKWFAGLFGFGLIAFVFARRWLAKRNKMLAKILLSVFIVFLVSFIIVEGLIASGANRKAKSGDAVIVLGAGLRGTNPGPILILRLNAAYDFLVDNPQAVCVVSGGQGTDEIISEAQAMANYLIRKGISEERIILENKSTNTIENFAYSKKLLDEHFDGQSYQAVYITNTYHVYRAGLIAEETGIKATAIAAPGLAISEVNYRIREYCCLVFHWLFRKKW